MILSVCIIAVICAYLCKRKNFLSVCSVRDKAFSLAHSLRSFENAEIAERKMLVIFDLLAEK